MVLHTQYRGPIITLVMLTYLEKGSLDVSICLCTTELVLHSPGVQHNRGLQMLRYILSLTLDLRPPDCELFISPIHKIYLQGCY